MVRNSYVACKLVSFLHSEYSCFKTNVFIYFQKEKKGLLKLLSGASTKRKPRASPPSSPTLEVEQAAAELALQGAVGPEVPSASSHGRAESCSADNETSTSMQDVTHRKASSLDSSIPIAPPPRQPCSSLAPILNECRPVVCER